MEGQYFWERRGDKLEILYFVFVYCTAVYTVTMAAPTQTIRRTHVMPTRQHDYLYGESLIFRWFMGWKSNIIIIIIRNSNNNNNNNNNNIFLLMSYDYIGLNGALSARCAVSIDV